MLFFLPCSAPKNLDPSPLPKRLFLVRIRWEDSRSRQGQLDLVPVHRSWCELDGFIAAMTKRLDRRLTARSALEFLEKCDEYVIHKSADEVKSA